MDRHVKGVEDEMCRHRHGPDYGLANHEAVVGSTWLGVTLAAIIHALLWGIQIVVHA
jgi:hypothetical protein